MSAFLEGDTGTEFYIRPSSLPMWPDCKRRTASRLFRRTIGQFYRLQEARGHVGAAVGTGAHAGIAQLLTEKLEARVPPNLPAAVDRAIEGMRERLAEGGAVVWDSATPSPDVAKLQLGRMVAVYFRQAVPVIEPVSVEERLEADLGGGFVLSGQSDLLAREPTRIVDLKTGRIRRQNIGQYGGYSILRTAHGLRLNALAEHFVKRSAMNKPQDDVLEVPFDLDLAERTAWGIIFDMKRSLGEFIRRVNAGDAPPEDAFEANPASMLCHQRYCPAWGTAFCRLGKGAPNAA